MSFILSERGLSSAFDPIFPNFSCFFNELVTVDKRDVSEVVLDLL